MDNVDPPAFVLEVKEGFMDVVGLVRLGQDLGAKWLGILGQREIVLRPKVPKSESSCHNQIYDRKGVPVEVIVSGLDDLRPHELFVDSSPFIPLNFEDVLHEEFHGSGA
jgi:hypothetical protein